MKFSARWRRRHGARPALILISLGAALLGGCTKQPGGQVVAVVDNEEITRQEVRAELGTSVDKSQKSATADVVRQLVDRNLLVSYARSENIDRAAEYVARRRQLEKSLLATIAIRRLVGPEKRITPAEIQKFIADNPTAFARREKLALDQVTFPMFADTAKLRMYSSLDSVDEVVRKLTEEGVEHQRQSVTVDTGTVDTAVARQIVAVPAGRIFNLSAGGVSYISMVTGRAPVVTDQAGWSAAATEAIKRMRRTTALAAAIEKLRKTAKIQYDPEFNPTPTKS